MCARAGLFRASTWNIIDGNARLFRSRPFCPRGAQRFRPLAGAPEWKWTGCAPARAVVSLTGQQSYAGVQQQQQQQKQQRCNVPLGPAVAGAHSAVGNAERTKPEVVPDACSASADDAIAESCAEGAQAPEEPLPSSQQLRLVVLASCVPFIGFGFADNLFMILFGDYFDTTLCVRLGLSTLTAAALGNLLSDILGIKLGEMIEVQTNRFCSLQPQMSAAQLAMRRTRRFYYLGCGLGMTLGCLLGMFPLLFLDTEEPKRRKLHKRKQRLLGELAVELSHCLKAESVTLYTVETQHTCRRTSLPPWSSTAGSLIQRFEWVYRWCKLRWSTKSCICTARQKQADPCLEVPVCFVSRDVVSGNETRTPITEGIPGLVYSTKRIISYQGKVDASKGQTPVTQPILSAWNPEDWRTDDDPNAAGYSDHHHHAPQPLYTTQQGLISEAQYAVGIPVLGVNRDVIGVIEVRNLLEATELTGHDKELLLAMASHIAVEIEGHQHLPHILSMCREQISTRYDVLKLSYAATLPPPSIPPHSHN